MLGGFRAERVHRHDRNVGIVSLAYAVELAFELGKLLVGQKAGPVDKVGKGAVGKGGSRNTDGEHKNKKERNNFFHFFSSLKQPQKVACGENGGGRNSADNTPPFGIGTLIKRQVSDKFAGLAVHGKGVFLTVIGGV